MRPSPIRTLSILAGCLVFCTYAASAHEVRPAYLGLTEISANVFDVVWKQPQQNGRRLAFDPVLPNACVATAVARIVFDAATVVKKWTIRCDERALPQQEIAIDGLSSSLTDVWVNVDRLHTNDSYTAVLNAANPTVDWRYESDRTLVNYIFYGVQHLLSGLDHILFIVGLMLFVKGWPAVIRTITAFTVAHSLSLAASSFGLVHLSTNPVEAAISLSILFLAFEASSPNKDSTLSARAPWLIAFACGLLHGLGFAGALSEIGLPSGYATQALLLFNLGIEFGQIVLVCVILLFVRRLSGWLAHRPAWFEQVPVYAMGALSSYWLLQRLAITVGMGDGA